MSKSKRPKVTIYTDGGCLPNPGPGGWGALLLFPDGEERELSGADPDTTNNQMEMMAAISALESLEEPHHIVLYTDSSYLKNGIQRWMENWQANGWKTSTGDPVKNQDLWQRLDAAKQRHGIEWRWVRGHSGDPNNERVDQMATAARVALTGEAPPQPKAEKQEEAPAAISIYVGGWYHQKQYSWGVVIIAPDETREYSGKTTRTTTNQILLEAAINALERMTEPAEFDVYTYSDYLQKGMQYWIHGWIKKGWITASGKPVKNRDLWQRLYQLAQPHQIRWRYREGKDSHLMRAVALARAEHE
jgi:ribonuclease HI